MHTTKRPRHRTIFSLLVCVRQICHMHTADRIATFTAATKQLPQRAKKRFRSRRSGALAEHSRANAVDNAPPNPSLPHTKSLPGNNQIPPFLSRPYLCNPLKLRVTELSLHQIRVISTESPDQNSNAICDAAGWISQMGASTTSSGLPAYSSAYRALTSGPVVQATSSFNSRATVSRTSASRSAS